MWQPDKHDPDHADGVFIVDGHKRIFLSLVPIPHTCHPHREGLQTVAVGRAVVDDACLRWDNAGEQAHDADQFGNYILHSITSEILMNLCLAKSKRFG